SFEDSFDPEVARLPTREGRASQMIFGGPEIARVEMNEARVPDHDALASRHLQTSQDEERALVVIERLAVIAAIEMPPGQAHRRTRFARTIARFAGERERSVVVFACELRVAERLHERRVAIVYGRDAREIATILFDMEGALEKLARRFEI